MAPDTERSTPSPSTPSPSTPSPSTPSPSTPAPSPDQRLARRLLLPVVALCCGVTVANIYLGQPLLTLIADGLQIRPAAAGWVATIGQLGYGLGLLLILPLGDLVPRRPLLITLLAGTSGALLLATSAPSLPVLLIAVLLASALTIVPQLLIPLVAAIAPPHKRAQVVGTAFAGLFAGIVLSRTVGGLIGEHAGWRTAFAVAALATAVVGGITVALLPHDGPRGGTVSYPRLLGSLADLLRSERTLRESALLQSLVFGTFSLFWTTMVFLLTEAPYHLDAGSAGLLGLVGLTGVVVAPLAGRFSDRVGSLPAAGLGAGVALAGAVLFTLGQLALPVALLAIALLTAGVPIAQVANQSRVLAARPEAANRMNTVYLVIAFVASSIGAALGSIVYGHAGWAGVSATGVGMSLLACLAWVWVYRRRAPLRVRRSRPGVAHERRFRPAPNNQNAP